MKLFRIAYNGKELFKKCKKKRIHGHHKQKKLFTLKLSATKTHSSNFPNFSAHKIEKSRF